MPSPQIQINCSTIEVEVIPADIYSDKTHTYPMTRKPRGKAVIINNMRKYLFNESQRFEHVFRELQFDVILINEINAELMVERIQAIKDEITDYDQAFILMVISHGENEKILGFDGCHALDLTDSNDINENHTEILQTIQNDVIDISFIVDMFSDIKCPQLNRKPKLFFFSCCRKSKTI